MSIILLCDANLLLHSINQGTFYHECKEDHEALKKIVLVKLYFSAFRLTGSLWSFNIIWLKQLYLQGLWKKRCGKHRYRQTDGEVHEEARPFCSAVPMIMCDGGWDHLGTTIENINLGSLVWGDFPFTEKSPQRSRVPLKMDYGCIFIA